MDNFFNFLASNPALIVSIISIIAVVILVIVIIYLVAFFQGREISFYPAKIGAKPDKTRGSKSGVSGNLTISLSDRTGFDIPIQERLEKAQTVHLLGLNLVNFVVQNQDIVELKALGGCKFKIVTLSPDFFQYKELFPGWHGGLRRKDDLELALRNIKHMMEKSENIQVRFLSFPPPFSLLAFNPDRPEGEVQIEFYTYEKDANKRPHFILKYSDNEKWFGFFRSEFEKAWEKAEPMKS
ncbi:MAG TPA: hypothetical protein VK206_28425 [Anaerolineales bacterium]|nr:hypothetical protein [Anaerolineales bacterium]